MTRHIGLNKAGKLPIQGSQVQGQQRATQIGLASGLFLISGFAALAYQVIWQRVLGVFSGAHIYSVTLIVTAFMAGLGFGSLVGGKLTRRMSPRKALLGFAVCELAIGSFALISPWLYYDVAYLKLGFLVRYPAVLPLAHFLLLLAPTFLMGASLPFLSRGLVVRLRGAARTIGILYGVNALGAALGAFVSVWFLIGAFGFVGTIRMAAALNLIAGIGALWMRSRIPPGEDAESLTEDERSDPRETRDASQPSGPPLGLGTWAAIYGLSGFIALSLEILWFRILDTGIKSSPYSFGHLLGTFLLFLALGSLVGARTVHRARRPDLIFFWGQWAIGLSAAFVLVLFSWLPTDRWPLASLYTYWSTGSGIEMHQIAEAWAGWQGGPVPDVLWWTAQIYAVLPIVLIAVPTFLMGWTYAYIQRTVQTDPTVVGWRVGVIQTANITGSMLGSFLTGAVFLTLLGTPWTLRMLVLLAGVFGWIAVRRSDAPRWAAPGVVVVGLLLAAAIPGSHAFWARVHGMVEDDIVVVEDASAVVAMTRTPERIGVLRVNGTSMTLMPYGDVWSVLGIVPVLTHPNPEEILLIGLGTGNTAWAAGAGPGVRRIDVYEIAKPEIDVLERAQSEWFEDAAVDQFLEDPRVNMTFSDGRLAMRIDDRKYDLIEADALEPYMAYSGNLYSREFFELVRGSLKPGGMVCTYTPTTRVRRTVVEVFPYVMEVDSKSAHFMMGSETPFTMSVDEILQRFNSPEVQAYLARSGMVERTAADMNEFLQTARITSITPENRESYPDGDVNTDLFPRDEYAKRHQRPGS